MAKRIAAIWFVLLVLILLLAGMVAAQERKPAPTWQEPSGPAKVLYEQATKFSEAGTTPKLLRLISKSLA
jgi:hypothetical protein